MPLIGLMVQAMVGQVHARAEVCKGCNTFANRLHSLHGTHVQVKGSDICCLSNPWGGELFLLEFACGADEHQLDSQAILLILG